MVNTTWTQTAGMTSDTETDNIEDYAEQAEASKVAAAASEAAAASSASTATTKASEASTSASNAANSANNAAASATSAASTVAAVDAAKAAALAAQAAAETAETNAETAETNAAASQTAAATSATGAAASASSATSSAASAASSATSASTSASSASTSATAATAAKTAAETAETNAETAQTAAEAAQTSATASASTATTKASEAATSASNASTSASTATTKASEAATSASNAAASEASASSSATSATASAATATTKASEASTSASNAAASEAAAEAAETNAQTSETNAAASASAASTSASNASTSETNAASSASSASTDAATATTKAGEAAASATSSANSATASEAAKDAALAALDNFDDRYLGSKASDPTVDNDGNPLVSGALYFNTTDDVMKVYDGSAWLAAYASLSGALLVANNLSDVNNASASRTNLGLAIGTNVQAYSAILAATTASYTTALNSKLNGIEAGATADQTASEIKTAYESNSNTNAFTDAEKTKLSGVEAGADVTDTTNVTAAGALMTSGGTMTGDVAYGDNVKATFGASSDLQIYHDGSRSLISDQGFGNLVIRAGDLTVQNPEGTETFIQAIRNGPVELYYDGSKKLETIAGGINVVGKILCVDELVIESTTGYGNIEIGGPSGAFIDLKSPFSDDYDGRLITDGASLYLTTSSDIPVLLKHNDAEKIRTTSTGISVTGNATFADNGKATFGASADLQIYHDGSNSYINDAGTGELRIQANAALDINKYTGENMARFFADGEVQLYHDNVQKLATKSTGIDVTGTVTADGLTVDGTTQLNSGATDEVLRLEGTGSPYMSWYDSGVRQAYIGSFGNTFDIIGDTPDTQVKISTGGVSRATFNSTGVDVTGTVSADGLVIEDGGSPTNSLDITYSGSSGQANIQADSDSGNAFLTLGTSQSGTVAERMRIDSSGNVGIGTTTPTSPLYVEGTIQSRLGASGVQIYGTGGSGEVASVGSLPLVFNVNSSAKMSILSSGNVGIGTTSPNSLLYLYGDPQATSGAVATIRDSSATSSNTSFASILFSSSPGTDYSIGKSNVNATSTLSFRNANTGTSYVDIDSSGNLEMTGGGSVGWANWTITESGGSLYFATGGTNKMKLDASGNLDVVGSVNSNATIT